MVIMLGILAIIRVEVAEVERGRTRNKIVCTIYNSRTIQKTLHARSQIAYTRNAQKTVGFRLSVNIG